MQKQKGTLMKIVLIRLTCSHVRDSDLSEIKGPLKPLALPA